MLLLVGCNNVFEQRRLAEQGVSKLQVAWNRGECASIYDEGDGYFRRNQLRDKWLRQCVELREHLGLWQSFQVRDGAVWPVGAVGIVWVEGTADFAGGQHTVRADFKLDNATAKLFHLQFELDGKLLQIPGYSGRLVD
jgi:hypothetical protein